MKMNMPPMSKMRITNTLLVILLPPQVKKIKQQKYLNWPSKFPLVEITVSILPCTSGGGGSGSCWPTSVFPSVKIDSSTQKKCW